MLLSVCVGFLFRLQEENVFTSFFFFFFFSQAGSGFLCMVI